LLQNALDCSALFVQAFMSNNVLPVVLHPLCLRTRTLCPFIFFQNSSCCWREGDLMTAWFKKNCWIYLGSFGQKTLANSSNDSKIAGFTVSSWKVSTLKGTGHSMEQQVNAVIAKKKILSRNFLITLCALHILQVHNHVSAS